MALLKKKSRVFRAICFLLAFLLVQNSLEQVHAQGTPFLPPGHNYFVDLSVPYTLPVLRGMRVYPDKPFEFDFVVGSGDRPTINQKETSLLIKYFLTCLTIPTQDLWVNLSPYESGRIIPDELAVTNAGNTLLEQDKLLKQLASSLTYPESRLGKEFWQTVYKKAYERFGTTDLPINTYNKVWIVPDKAIVYDMGNSALIGETHLKVMLEEDYLALKKHMAVADKGDLHRLTSIITKEIILPELEKEINEGKNFAPVRQIFHSMVLAAWFKRALKRNVLSNFYVNKKKISGVDGVDKNAKEEIYKQYLRMYKVGAYNYIREDVDPITQQVVPHKYFSGGLFFGDLDRAMRTLQVPDPAALEPLLNRSQITDSTDAVAKVDLIPIGGDEAMLNLLKNPAMRSDSTPLSKSILSKFLLTVAVSLTTPLAVGRFAQAQQFPKSQITAPATSGNILKYGGAITPEDREYIKKLRKIITLEDVIALNGKKNPQTGRIYNVDIPYIARHWDSSFEQNYEGRVLETLFVTLENKEGLRFEDGRMGTETKKGIALAYQKVNAPDNQDVQSDQEVTIQPLPATPTPQENTTITNPESSTEQGPIQQPATTPAPQQRDQQLIQPTATIAIPTLQISPAAAPVLISTQPIYAARKSYQVATRMPINPVEDHVVAKIGGIVTGWDANKVDYKEGETVFTFQDLELDSRIEELRAESQVQENKLGEVKALFNAQAATDQELSQAQQQFQEVKQKLAQANIEKDNETVKAPHDLKIIDAQVANGVSISKGTQLFRYYDLQRVRVDVDVPNTVNYFGDITLTLNGDPVKSVFSSTWSPTPSLQTRLSLIVIPSSPILPGQIENVAARIYEPGKDTKKLYSIAGAQTTMVTVGNVEEHPLTVPLAGSVNFLVHEGDNVKAGQVLARVDVKPYQQQLDNIILAVKNIDDQLNQVAPSADGTQYVGRDQLDNLKVQKIKLVSQEKTLQEQITRTEISSPYNSVIDWSAENSASVFQSQDVLFHIPGPVFLGDMNNTKSAILFSKGIKINAGDPVLVRTVPQGIRLLGEVTAVNKNPSSPSIQLSQVQSVEVKVFDPQHTLRPGLGVQVSLVKESDKQAALDMLSAGRSDSIPLSSSPPPPPLQTPFDGFIAQLLAPSTAAPKIVAQVPPSYYFTSPQGPSLNSSEVVARVLNNELVAGPEYINYLKSKANEGLPGALQLSLFGDVLDNNGKLTFAGGADGALNGWAATALTGNAIGAGLPVVTELVGNLMDHMDGTIKKQKGIAATNTKVAYYHYLTVLYQQTYEAQRLLIELGADQNKISRKEAQVRNLKQADEEIMAREKAGFNSTSESKALDQQYRQAQEELLALKSDLQDKTIALNVLTGQPIADLEKPVSANLPWTGNFATIPTAAANVMRSSLVASNSLNTQLQQDLFDRKKMGGTLALEGLDRLPQLNLTGIDSTGNPNGSQFDLLPGAQEHTNQLAQGLNAILHLRIPIFNKPLKIARGNAALDVKNADNNIKRTSLNLTAEFDMTVNHINNLSEEIQLAEKAYNDAYNAWNLKAGNKPNLFLDTQLGDDENRMVKAWSDLVDLKAQYFESKAYLEQMGLLKQGGSLVDDKVNADKAQLTLVAAIRQFVLLVAFSMMPLAAQQSDQQPTGSFGYNPGQGMSISDSNPMNRMAALDVLKESPENRTSIDSLETSVMIAPADVRQEIFEFMIGRKNLRFFIQLIDKAHQRNRQDIVNLAYQSVGDILTDNPTIVSSLYPSSFNSNLLYTDQTERAEKAFLAFIAQDPDGLPQNNLLLSDYWRTDELARIYNKLDGYLRNHPNDEQVMKMKALIFDVMVRKIFLVRVNAHFTEGPLQNANSYSPFIHNDNIFRAQVKELPEEYRLFFNSSQWRQEMGDLRPDLLAEAQQTAQRLIDQDSKFNQSGGESNNSPLDTVPDEVAPQDSLTFLGSLDYSGQQKYIAQAKNAELARVLQSRTILQSPLLLSDILNRLMADQDGRLLLLQAYTQSSDDDFLKLIEASQNIDTIKEDAKAIKNPAAMRIFREALIKISLRSPDPKWLREAIWGTYSPMELHSLLKGSTTGSEITTAQINLIATRQALEVLLDEYPEIKNKDSFIAGQTVYSAAKEELLNQIAEKATSLNDPQELEAYLNEQAERSPEDQRTIDELRSYRDAFVKTINQNNQDIIQGSAWMKSIQWLYHTSLYGSFLLVIGGMFSILQPILLDWGNRKFASTSRLMYLSDKELLNSRDKDEDGKGIDKNRTEPAVVDLLKAWDDVLNEWTEDDQYLTEDMLSDQNLIDNFADQFIRAIPYTPDLMDSRAGVAKNQVYQDSFAYFSRLANKTSKILSDRLKNRSLSAHQQERFWENNEKMLLKMLYAQKYLDILQGRVNINISTNEHFHKNSWREKLNKFATWILGFNYLSQKPQKKLGDDLRDLMELGNLVVRGLYNNMDGIVNESQKRLDEVITKSKRFGSFGYAASGENTRIRSWRTRWIFLIPNIIFLSAVILGAFGVVPFNFLNVIYFFGTFSFTLAIYWTLALTNTGMAENKKIKEIVIRLYNEMAESIRLVKKAKDWKSFKKEIKEAVIEANSEPKIVRLAQMQGEDNRVQEFRDKNIDEMVFIAENPQDIPGLKRQIEGMVSNGIIRQDVSWEIMPWGSQDGDTFLNALLGVKKWQGKNKMFVFVGNGVRPNDPRIELCIKNLYGAAVSMPEGGLVMAKADDIYMDSSVKHVPGSDLTSGTTWASREDLQNDQSRLWLVTDAHKGKTKIRRMYWNFDLLSKLRNSSSLAGFLKERHDIANGIMQQFSFSNDIFSMSPKAVNMFTSIAEELKGEQLRLNDLLVLVQMATDSSVNNQEGELNLQIARYLQTQHLINSGNGVSKESKDSLIKSLKEALEGNRTKLYFKIGEIAREAELKTSAHFPVRGTVIFESNPSGDRVKRLLLNSNAAMTATAKTPGGIDLNFQPQFIQRSSTRSSEGIQEANALNVPDGFKGFNFNIISFTPQLTVNGAFQLMFNSSSG